MSYSFYCRKCKFDHAGECAGAEQEDFYPEVGSRWILESDHTGKWAPLDPTGEIWFEVVAVDKVQGKVAVVGRYGASGAVPPKYWGPDGGEDNPGRTRYVKFPG